MSEDMFEALVQDLCSTVGLPQPEVVLSRGWIEVDGFEIGLSHFNNDPNAMYLTYRFGHVVAGRTLKVYRLLLEANLSVYAQDQAQMGIEGDAGTVTLIVRVEMTPDVTGDWLADTLSHYTEHGRYWQQNILSADDALFEGACSGSYCWIKS